MCCRSCRDTSAPSEIPSSTSTVWVRTGGTTSGRPAIAAMPTAIMAPEIRPPGRCAHRKSAPPAAPITSVSSTSRVLMRLGMAEAVDAGIRHTPPYGKFARPGQMRQRDAAMRVLKPAVIARESESRVWRTLRLCDLSRLLSVPVTLPRAGGGRRQALGLRLGGGVLCRLFAFGHELLALLAVDALGIGFLRAFERCLGPRLLGLLFRGSHFGGRRGG